MDFLRFLWFFVTFGVFAAIILVCGLYSCFRYRHNRARNRRRVASTPTSASTTPRGNQARNARSFAVVRPSLFGYQIYHREMMTNDNHHSGNQNNNNNNNHTLNRNNEAYGYDISTICKHVY